MNLVGKTSAPSIAAWQSAPVAVRTRPGDRPVWVQVDTDIEQLRDSAARSQVPVDVAAALVLEWGLCSDIVSAAAGLPLIEIARMEIAQPRLAPTDDLRSWEQQLAGGGPTPDDDELPELCLPERIAVRLPKTVHLCATDLDRLADASLCDRAASRLGMTLEVWVLRRVASG